MRVSDSPERIDIEELKRVKSIQFVLCAAERSPGEIDKFIPPEVLI